MYLTQRIISHVTGNYIQVFSGEKTIRTNQENFIKFTSFHFPDTYIKWQWIYTLDKSFHLSFKQLHKKDYSIS